MRQKKIDPFRCATQMANFHRFSSQSSGLKLPPATEKHTTSPTVVPTMRLTEDSCLCSETEMTIETITYSTIYYGFMKILPYINVHV